MGGGHSRDGDATDASPVVCFFPSLPTRSCYDLPLIFAPFTSTDDVHHDPYGDFETSKVVTGRAAAAAAVATDTSPAFSTGVRASQAPRGAAGWAPAAADGASRSGQAGFGGVGRGSAPGWSSNSAATTAAGGKGASSAPGAPHTLPTGGEPLFPGSGIAAVPASAAAAFPGFSWGTAGTSKDDGPAYRPPQSPSASFDAGGDLPDTAPPSAPGPRALSAPVSFDSDLVSGLARLGNTSAGLPPLRVLPTGGGALVPPGALASTGVTPKLGSAASSACTSPRGVGIRYSSMSPAALRLHLQAVAEVQATKWHAARERAAMGTALRKAGSRSSTPGADAMAGAPAFGDAAGGILGGSAGLRPGVGGDAAGGGDGGSHAYDVVQASRLKALRTQQAAAEQALARAAEMTALAKLQEHVEELNSSPRAAALLAAM